MATVFSYDQSADVMSRIKTSRDAINNVFADCDKVSSQLQENIQTVGFGANQANQDISSAALQTYESLKKHYEEFITLIQNNEQNITRHSENMQTAQSASTSALQDAESKQSLQ